MDEKKLELRLAPPGDDDYPSTNPALSLGYSSCVGAKRGFSATVEPKTEAIKGDRLEFNRAAKWSFAARLELLLQKVQLAPLLIFFLSLFLWAPLVFKQQPGFLKLQQTKDLLQKTSGGAEISKQQCPPPSHASKNAAAVQNSSQTRVTSAPVVGWPPIRSFRRNLATTSSSKPTLDSHDESLEKEAKLEAKTKGLFVKINMDRIPIGRKVDLKAYDSYEKLSLAVDELFRGLLAAQRDPLAAGTQRNLQKEQAITGLLDGSGEFTLVYEDDEGDRMLVGDVPWEMFVSTAKRLRVLKSSELSTLRLGTINRKRATEEC